MTYTSLRELVDLGVLSELDAEFALVACELVGEHSSPILLGAAFASWAVQNGHTCARLEHLSVRTFYDEEGQPLTTIELPPFAEWLQALRTSALVTQDLAADGQSRPLVLDASGRLYLARYFGYEKRLAEAIAKRASVLESRIDGPLLRRGLDRLFAPEDPVLVAPRRAALIAVLRRFSVISGGPGTGKTFTVAKVLSLLQEQALANGGRALRIELLAPTGKAAQRLSDALRASLARLDCSPAVLASIPTTASTIHRVLGFQPRTPTRFRHGRQHPLPRDVVVVDEASMVDLALMTKLVEAVAPEARLVLLGDKDQLASVEAGAILSDICADDANTGYSSTFASHVLDTCGLDLPIASDRTQSGIRDATVHFVHSHRFQGNSGIAALAEAVNAGDATRAREALSRYRDIELRPLPDPALLREALEPVIAAHFAALAELSPREQLARLDEFRILCCHRRGPLGVDTVNQLVTDRVRRLQGAAPDADWFAGRPILVSANDYQLDLYNGDVGVAAPLVPSPNGPDAADNARERREADARDRAPLVVHFRTSEETELRHVAPGRLPSHEAAYAMSVHKSQGSEFGEVWLVLPQRPSQLLTRELVYTALTRARRKVTILGSFDVLRHAIMTRVERSSGLRDALNA